MNDYRLLLASGHLQRHGFLNSMNISMSLLEIINLKL